MAVDPIPTDYPRVTPYLCVDGAGDAIEFYQAVLGAEERMRIAAPDGKIGHAELGIGDSVVMLSDEYPEMDIVGPAKIGGSPVTIHVAVENADEAFARAMERGATELRPVDDQFYGDRSGQFVDPWGHRWSVAHHVEDVEPDELMRRAAEMMSEG